MSLVIKFYFTSSMLNTFRTLIHSPSAASDFSIVSPHWSRVLVSMCVGVSVWLGFSGIRVAGLKKNTHARARAHTHTHTHTHIYSEYVILIAFPLQQWLREHASMLRLYVHCLSYL